MSGDYLLVLVAAGIMTGITIVLWRTVRCIVEMERCMDGLIHELLSGSRIANGKSTDPFGATDRPTVKDFPQA
ncbi:MAG: hypothetical protein WD711_13460 [Dongiaceae bacterium]